MKKYFTSALTSMVLATTMSVHAMGFPNKPITIIVHSSPGGQLDLTARALAPAMGEYLKQRIIIENKPGASGLIGIHQAKRSPADGYTILAAASTISALPSLKINPGYDLKKDFAAIGGMVKFPYVAVTASSSSFNNIKEFVDKAKAAPEKYSYASAGNGSTSHMAPALLIAKEKINVVNIPYKGNGAALPDVISGRAEIFFENYGIAQPHIAAGRLKPLAVTSEQRMPELPNVPTVKEQLHNDYVFNLWLGLFAPKGTQPEVLNSLQEALKFALSNPDTEKKFQREGISTFPIFGKDFEQVAYSDQIVFDKLVKDIGYVKD